MSGTWMVILLDLNLSGKNINLLKILQRCALNIRYAASYQALSPIFPSRTFFLVPHLSSCQRKPCISSRNVRPRLFQPPLHILCFTTEIAVLVDDSRGHLTPSLASLQNWVSGQDVLSHQLLASHAKGTDRPERTLSEEALKKREERKMKAKTDVGLLPVPDQETISETITPLQSAAHSQNPALTHTVVIPVSSKNLDWYCPSKKECIYTSVESAIDAGIWKFPSTPYERARCGIFRDLRGKGYFIGGGVKFGGEYVVYPGWSSPSEPQ